LKKKSTDSTRPKGPVSPPQYPDWRPTNDQGARIRGDKGNFQLTPDGDEAIRGAGPISYRTCIGQALNSVNSGTTLCGPKPTPPLGKA
jgi:hypothetical protein